MKKTFTFLAVFLFFRCLHSYGQVETDNTTFESLKLNSSPAFVLLGVEPDNIQRPSTPSQLVAGLQNAVVDGKIQPNVAFEISPYYLVNPKNTTSKRFDPRDYLLDKKSVGATLFRTLSISLASSQTDMATFGNLKSGTGIGLGLRTQIVDGQPYDRLYNYEADYDKTLFLDLLSGQVDAIQGTADFSAIFDITVKSFEKNALPASHVNVLSDRQWKKYLKELKEEMLLEIKAKNLSGDHDQLIGYIDKKRGESKAKRDAELTTLNHSVNPLTKQGFMLELAAGQAYVFQENVYNEAANAKTAIWLTPSYRWQVSGDDNQQISLVDLMTVFRYTLNNQAAGVDVANYFDAGLKGAFTKGNFSGSVEYVYRNASHIPAGLSKRYTDRLSIGIDYKISPQITFKFNFGSNFDGNTTTYSDPKKMFAIGGLNFGLLNFKKTN